MMAFLINFISFGLKSFSIEINCYDYIETSVNMMPNVLRNLFFLNFYIFYLRSHFPHSF